MRKGMEWVDLPPVWLIGHMVLAWSIGALMPPVIGEAGRWIGSTVGLAGVGLMVAAVVQMVALRTTVIPRRTPSALVTTGVFGWSRNPIYLADALILTGAILWWDAVLALPLVASFVSVITARFIRDEEGRLTAAFGPEFDLWAGRVRRWFGRR